MHTMKPIILPKLFLSVILLAASFSQAEAQIPQGMSRSEIESGLTSHDPFRSGAAVIS